MAIQPNTPYQWKDDAQFTLNGKEFELLINTVRAILTTPESQKVLLLAQVNNVLENLLAKEIQSGQVFQVEESAGEEKSE